MSAQERKRGIAIQLLLNSLDALKTKIDVLSEPYLEAKRSMAEAYKVVVPVLQDYDQMRKEVANLREEVAVYRKEAEKAKEKVKKLEGKKPTKKKEKKEKEVKP